MDFFLSRYNEKRQSSSSVDKSSTETLSFAYWALNKLIIESFQLFVPNKELMIASLQEQIYSFFLYNTNINHWIMEVDLDGRCPKNEHILHFLFRSDPITKIWIFFIILEFFLVYLLDHVSFL